MAPVRERLILRQPGNWAWPNTDLICWGFLHTEEPDIPEWVMSRVPGRRTVVQAGGNCGFYTRKYAKEFQRVITFEPEAVNFHALVRNVDDDNTFFYRAFLADEPGEAVLAEDTYNGGAHYLYRGDVPPPAVDAVRMVPCVTIDSLGLSQVDLIHLDIEGFEYNALLGAFQTVNRCRPWIALERRDGYLDRYKLSHEKLIEWLDGMSYELADSYKHENLYRPLP